MTENTRKILGLTHKRMREEEEILGRPMKIDDMIYQFAHYEMSITINKYRFLPNQQVRVRNFRGQQTGGLLSSHGPGIPNDMSFIPCSITYEEVTYLQGYPGQFSEKVFIIIPNTKVPGVTDPNFSNGSGVSLNGVVSNIASTGGGKLITNDK